MTDYLIMIKKKEKERESYILIFLNWRLYTVSAFHYK